MRKLGWIVGLILIIALGLLVARSMGKRGAERKAEAEAASAHAIPVQTARVEVGDIGATIETSGSIAVRDQADIVAKISGRVGSVLVDEGDAVRTGQVVVRLEQDDILAQLGQAKAAVEAAEAARGAAQAQLTALRTGARTQERRQAEAGVAQARANLENARSSYERMKRLSDLGAISKQQMDLVQMQYDVAKAQYESAQEQLSLVREGPRAEEVQAAEQRLKQAEGAVAQAKAALQLARVQLTNTFIKSPVSGRVSRRMIEPGEMAAPGVPLLHVVNNQTAYVQVSLPDVQADKVKAGVPAEVTIDGIPGRSFRGHVTEVNPASDPASRSRTVKISLENPSAEVKPGMFARVSLVVERRQGVVVLPRQVVIERGRAYVMVRDGSVARERAVTLGLANQERVEVTGGLHPGEEVVVVGQELLKEGDPIEVTKQGGRS